MISTFLFFSYAKNNYKLQFQSDNSNNFDKTEIFNSSNTINLNSLNLTTDNNLSNINYLNHKNKKN